MFNTLHERKTLNELEMNLSSIESSSMKIFLLNFKVANDTVHIVVLGCLKLR